VLELGTNAAGRTFSAQFSPDGRYFATLGNSALKLYKIEPVENAGASGGLQLSLIKTIQRYGFSLAFSPDSRWLAYAAANKIYLWDFNESSEPRPLDARISARIAIE
jgi:WD40 repeat protein